jgi:hypothetical protein
MSSFNLMPEVLELTTEDYAAVSEERARASEAVQAVALPVVRIAGELATPGFDTIQFVSAVTGVRSPDVGRVFGRILDTGQLQFTNGAWRINPEDENALAESDAETITCGEVSLDRADLVGMVGQQVAILRMQDELAAQQQSVAAQNDFYEVRG